MIIGNKTVCGKEIQTLKYGSERIVEAICDNCGKEMTLIYHNYTESQKRRGWPLTTYCRKCSSKDPLTKKKLSGRQPHNKGKKYPERSGANSPTWKGGSYIDGDGYRMLYIGNSKRQSCGWNSYRKEHSVVMEETLGRPLEKGEVVHHIDGDKLNNSLENLYLCRSDKEHRTLHNSLEKITMGLVRAGLIVFNKDSQSYMADPKLRELLEHPEEDNQQPSLEGNFLEGSETRSYYPAKDYEGPRARSTLSYFKSDDIVRATDITNETVELPDKEQVG